MNCERIEAQLIAYIDGKATEAERREVDLHIVACPMCRDRVREFRAVSGLLDELPTLELTPSFDARLQQRINSEPAPSWLQWLQPLPRFAMAVSLLLMMAVWVGRGTIEPQLGDVKIAEVAVNSEEEFKMINNLQVLEDF